MSRILHGSSDLYNHKTGLLNLGLEVMGYYVIGFHSEQLCPPLLMFHECKVFQVHVIKLPS